ncbi:MAG TPA: F0F1 ATP synthase subunit delta [Candidatus Omnitrophota bacterium]|nr:F0F1 ATP synthase subunit delta [Candidatus Omnitrophota bacterium]
MFIVGFVLIQIVVFGVLYYAFKKITGGDTENAVKRLSVVYEDLVKKQKDLTEKIEEGERELQAKKEEAAAIAEKLATQALEEVRKKEEEVLRKARAEADEILAKAHGSREALFHDLEIEANKKMIDFVADLLKVVLDSKTSALIHGQFVRNFIEQAKKSDLASVDAAGQSFVLRAAMPLKEEERAEINKILSEKLGAADIKLEEVQDEKLVAGIALQIGSLILEGNFANSVKDAAIQRKEKLKS